MIPVRENSEVVIISPDHFPMATLSTSDISGVMAALQNPQIS
jgi:galactose-1-phosphate uridylyltransferase